MDGSAAHHSERSSDMRSLLRIKKKKKKKKKASPTINRNQFVQANFKMRQCNAEIRDSQTYMCGCNHDSVWHESMKIEAPMHDAGPWDPKRHTRGDKATNAHGKLKLHGYGRIRAGDIPKYIRLDALEPDFEALWTLLTEHWGVPKPQLILSINGGAKKMGARNMKINSALKKGLMSVTASATTWFITPGFHLGVSKLVGEAVRDFSLANTADVPIVAIGMMTWGAVYNRHALEDRGRTALTNDMCVAEYKYNSNRAPSGGQAVLDPNHTHFIFCDDGTQKKYNAEMAFRAGFEAFASGKMKDAATSCSVVQVIIDGGEETIKAAYKAIKEETPVVFIEGSGRAADLVSKLLSFSTTSKTEKELKEEISEQLEHYELEDGFNFSSNEDKEALSKNLLSMCTTRRRLVFSVSVDGLEHLDRVILMAIIKSSSHMTRGNQLALAMSMNRSDLAAQEIIPDWNRRVWKNLDLDHYMMKALKRDQTAFVELFLDLGVSIENFLNEDRLKELYLEAITAPNCSREADQLLEILEGLRWRQCCVSAEASKLEAVILPLVGRLVQKFTNCGDSMPNPYDPKFTKDEEHGDSTSSRDCPHGAMGRPDITPFPPRSRDDGKRLYTEQDLLLWAVLFNRFNLAKVFWRFGKDHIGSALVAAAILKRLQTRARKDGEQELSESLEQHSDYFERMATGVLSVAYQQDKNRAHLLLIRGLPYWGNTTLLTLADRTTCMLFMSRTAVQTKLLHIWMSDISPSVPKWKIFLNLFFSFLCIRLIPFRVLTNPAAKQSPASDDHPFRQKQRHSWKNVGYFKAIYLFHNAPFVKFLMNAIFYLFFVLIFGYQVLVELRPFSYYTQGNGSCSGVQTTSTCTSRTELVVYFFFFSFIVEEMRQALMRDKRSISYNLHHWFSSGWNKFDIVLYLTFVTALVLRYTLPDSQFVHVRNTFVAALAMLMLRFMQVYYAHRSIGPKVVMITKMVNDIVFFLAIFLVFLLTYGAAAQALLYPNHPLNLDLFKKIVFCPYWQVFGELNLQEVEGKNAGQSSNALVVFLFAAYMLFTNVLLLNLLIAMFGFTFEKVQLAANTVWAFNRYELIKEYFDRPFLPPPFIPLHIIYDVCAKLVDACRRTRCCRKCCKDPQDEKSDFKKILGYFENQRMTAFEQNCMERYISENHEQCDLTAAPEVSERSSEVADDVMEQMIVQRQLFEKKSDSKDGSKRRVPGNLPSVELRNPECILFMDESA